MERRPSKKTIPLKPRDMGLAGFALLVSQFVSTYQSASSVTSEIHTLQISVQELKLDQERHFAKKEEFVNLNKKMTRMNDQLIRMSEQIKLVRSDFSANKKELKISSYACTNILKASFIEGTRKNAAFNF